MKDYYQTLGIDKTVSGEEIKAAYRKLSKKYHPDINQDNQQSEKLFIDIQEAYEVLSDQDKRAVYDINLAKSLSQPKFFSETFQPKNNNEQPVNVHQKNFTGIIAFRDWIIRKKYFLIVMCLILIIIFIINIRPNEPDSIVLSPTAQPLFDNPAKQELPSSFEKTVTFWKNYSGVWSGKGTEINLHEEYVINLICDFEKHHFEITYPGMGFGGEWKLLNLSNEKAEFEEVLNSGVLNHTQGGKIELSIIDKNNMSFKYFFPLKHVLMATGKLKRQAL